MARKSAAPEPPDFGTPGPPINWRAPYFWGFLVGLGFLTAWVAGNALQQLGGVLIEVMVAFFTAAGVYPLVRWLERRGLTRAWALLVVILIVLGALALFLFALVPVITDQVQKIANNAPGWLDSLLNNKHVRNLDDQYHFIDKLKSFVTGGDFVSKLFGGALGIGLKVLSALLNGLIVTVMTLYFIVGYEPMKATIFKLAPASRRDRVTKLGEKMIDGIGGYVSGAFIIAVIAGLSSLVFLFACGLGQYAVALAFVVMITDVIPMIGATIGAVIVTAIGFANSPSTGIACVIFYLVYQQIENYVIYPRVMSSSVDVPGVVTVIAALVGASLLGVVGALMAIPVAAAILMLMREVVYPALDRR